MAFAKALDLLRLADFAAASHMGVSLEQIREEYGVSHRTAQRMTDALEDAFPNAVQVVEGEDRRKRWTAREVPLLFKIATPGRHFAMNGLGALAAAKALGADLALAAGSLGRWTPYKGRGVRETIVLDPVDTHLTLELIDDSYNANPTSMAASLEVLAASAVTDGTGRVSKGRRIAFLGDMKELGPDAVALHAGLAHLDAVKGLDVVHCIGPLMRSLYDILPEHQRGDWTETAEDMAQGLRRKLDSGDVVLAKGSLSMQLARIVDAIRKMGHPGANDPAQTT